MAVGGWLIGVLLNSGGEGPVRHFYAIAQPDRARAEWAAADYALTEGAVAVSPHGGVEPVEAVCELSQAALKSLALRPGQVKALGWKWPRRWVVG
jgi:hypothetical protein